MGRRYFLVLIIAAGCAPLKVPVDFYISASCNAVNAKAIRAGAELWNKASCVEVLRYQGVNNDEIFNLDDLQDDMLTVYCVEDENAGDVKDILLPMDLGYSVGDILLPMKRIRDFIQERFKKSLSAIPEQYFSTLRELAAHEFGHRLGFSHKDYEDAPSIMRKENDPYNALTPSRLDIYGSSKQDGLCDRIECPPREQCTTSPKF